MGLETAVAATIAAGSANEERKTGKRASKRQKNLIAEQRKKEQFKQAGIDDEVARKKALSFSPRAGRRSLISPQGLKQTLG